jgi:DNA-directed RNA polymerase alpha subunit
LESVYDLLVIPRCFLLVLNDEILSEYSISQKVKDEMESVLLGLVPIMKLDVRNLLEEPDYSVFVDYRDKIDERKTLLYDYL